MNYLTRGLEYPGVEPVYGDLPFEGVVVLDRIMTLRSGQTLTSKSYRRDLVERGADPGNAHYVVSQGIYLLREAGYLVRVHRKRTGKGDPLYIAYSRPRDQVVMPDEDPNRPAIYWPERTIGRVVGAAVG